MAEDHDMTSKPETRYADLAPAALSPTGSAQPEVVEPLPRRQATLYDAVAGRCSENGFPDRPSGHAAVPAEKILFQRADAPDRYEETDTYFASSALPSSALPDSDLVKALHAYAADYYYSAVHSDERSDDYESMDETALLALGVLMEELCREQLGETGDLVFTEEGEMDANAEGRVRGRKSRSRGRKSRSRTRSRGRATKRRKFVDLTDG